MSKFYTLQDGRTHWRIDTEPDTVGNVTVAGGYTNKAQVRKTFHPLTFGSLDSAIKHYEKLDRAIGTFGPLVTKLRELNQGDKNGK